MRAAVDQQALGRAAHAGAPHLGVEHQRDRDVEIGAAIDVGVADAFEMREHRHAGLGLHAGDEALAAARHDHVDGAVEARQHVADGVAIGGRHQLDRGLGQLGCAQALDQAGVDARRRMPALGAAAQDRGVAGLQGTARRRRR